MAHIVYEPADGCQRSFGRDRSQNLPASHSSCAPMLPIRLQGLEPKDVAGFEA